MKKIFIALSAFVLSFSFSCATGGLSSYEDKFYALVDDLALYGGVREGDDEALLELTGIFTRANSLLLNGSVSLEIVNEKGLIKGVQFITKDQVAGSHLKVTKEFLDTYKKPNTFHFSIVMREFTRMYSASVSPGYYNQEDVYDQILYLIDTYNVQASMTAYLFYPHGLTDLTSYEKSIIYSVQNDEYSSALYQYELITIEVVQAIHILFNDYIADKRPLGVLQELNASFQDTIKLYREGKTADDRYPAYSAIYTADKMLPIYLAKLDTKGAKVFAETAKEIAEIASKGKKEAEERTKYYHGNFEKTIRSELGL